MEKTKLKKLKNVQLAALARHICNAVVASKLEGEISHPLFLRVQELTYSFSESRVKVHRSKYEEDVMAAELKMKKVYRSFYQNLVFRASDLDPMISKAAKLLLKKLDYTASAFERLRQVKKLYGILSVVQLLRNENVSEIVGKTVAPEMIEQLEACYKAFDQNKDKRTFDKIELRKTPTATQLRTPLIEAICKYYLHLYIENEADAVEESVSLMKLINFLVDESGTRKYTFKTRKPAAPKVKKRKKKKPLL